MIMASFLKELERAANRAQRERIRQEKIENRIRYNNAIQVIEKNNEIYNSELKDNLYYLANPQLKYEFIENIKEFVDDYYDKQKEDEIVREFREDEPISLSEYLKENNVPKRKIIREKFNESLKQERIKLENKYTKKYNTVYLIKIEKENKENKKIFNKLLKEENEKIIEYNNNLEKRKQDFFSGKEKEVEKIMFELFKNNMGFAIDESIYPINKNFSFDSKKRTLNIELFFFTPSAFLKIQKSRRYIKKDNEYKYTYLSETEINKYYESYLLNTALYIVYSIANNFENLIDYFYLNCYIDDINPNSGKKDKILVLSSNLETINLKQLNIETINAKEYFKNIKARISKNMKNLISVNPISINYTKNYEKYSMDNINYNIDGFEFENLSKDLLLSYGFDQVEVTKSSGDYGADVVAYKDDIKYAIQCKKYSSKVGVSAIQEVIASKSIYNCHVAVVLTNNYFTPNAIRLAKENNVLLWDRDKLIIMLRKHKDKMTISNIDN